MVGQRAGTAHLSTGGDNAARLTALTIGVERDFVQSLGGESIARPRTIAIIPRKLGPEPRTIARLRRRIPTIAAGPGHPNMGGIVAHIK